MALAFPARRVRLPHRPIQVVLAFLFLAHLAQGFRGAGGIARLSGRPRTRSRPLAGELFGALAVFVEHEIGRFLARKRVLAEIFIPARAPFLERFIEEFFVARGGEFVALDAFIERGALLFGLRRFRGRLLGFGSFRLALDELLFQLPHLLLQIGRGGAVFRDVVEIARDGFELVAEDALDGGFRAAIILAVAVGDARFRKRAVLARDGGVDAIVFRLLLAVFALALVEVPHLGLVPVECFGEMLVALDLIELLFALTLAFGGRFFGIVGFGILVVALAFVVRIALLFRLRRAVERPPARFERAFEVLFPLLGFRRCCITRRRRCRRARGWRRRGRLRWVRLRGVLRLRVRRFRYFRVRHCLLLRLGILGSDQRSR